MRRFARAFGSHDPNATYVEHAFPERMGHGGDVDRQRGVRRGDRRLPRNVTVTA